MQYVIKAGKYIYEPSISAAANVFHNHIVVILFWGYTTDFF